MTTATTTSRPVDDPSKNREERRAAAKKSAAAKPVEAPKPKVEKLAVVVPGGTGKSVTVDLSVDEIAAMSKEARLAACKPERQALAAWKAAGRQGDRPLTPIMSWMENPTVAKARAKKAGTRRSEVIRTEEQHDLLTQTIVAERQAGTSWFSIAKKLTALEIPATANGNQWFNTTAFGTAKRLGLVVDGEGLSRRAGTAKPKAAKPVTKKAAAKKVTAKQKDTAATERRIAHVKAAAAKPIVTVGQRKAVTKKTAAKK